jgi:5'-3' exonuclease
MKIHLVDGTYELFRAYFAMPKIAAPDGRPAGAVRGIVQTLMALMRQDGVTHVACAFDHVIESFRNELFEGYKTGEGVPEDLLSQFELAEQAVAALGLVVWSMTEFEADDAIATAAHRWASAPGVEQVVICSPDKDMAQVVRNGSIVCLDRRRNVILDADGVREKFGVAPVSIPDYLALVGDPADGIPGVPRWGARSTAPVLAKFGHIENIPGDPAQWGVNVRGAKAMAESLVQRHADALLYKRLATLRLDVPLFESLEDLEWRGVPRKGFEGLCAELGFSGLMNLPQRWSV